MYQIQYFKKSDPDPFLEEKNRLGQMRYAYPVQNQTRIMLDRHFLSTFIYNEKKIERKLIEVGSESRLFDESFTSTDSVFSRCSDPNPFF